MPPPIFAGNGFTGFSLYPCDSLPEDAVVKLTGTAPSGRLEFVVAVPPKANVVSSNDEAILHKMFARSIIKDVEEKERTLHGETSCKSEAVQLSIQHSVLCSLTAFVAIEHEMANQKMNGSGPIEHAAEVSRQASHQDQRHVLFGQRLGQSGAAFRQDLNNQIMLQDLEAKLGQLRCLSADISHCLEAQSCRIDSIDCDIVLQSAEACNFQLSMQSSVRPKFLRRTLGAVAFCGSVCVAGVSALWSGVSAILSRGSSVFSRETAALEHSQLRSKNSPPGPLSKTATNEGKTVQKPFSATPADFPCQAAAPIAGPRSSNLESLENLLRMAHFNGSFSHSPELQVLTSIDQQVVAWWAQEDWSSSIADDILVTSLVLSCLNRDFSAQRATWELVGRKAKEWLQAQSHLWRRASINTVDDLLRAAASRLA